MDYAEHPLPPALDGLVAALWTASVPGDGPAWIEQEAVPDGCVELIVRHAGRSVWRREQPARFATGLATVPARLSLGAGARFTGIKLWPWAWHALGGARCTRFADDWVAVTDPSLAALTAAPVDSIPALLEQALADTDPRIGRAVIAGESVAGIAAAVGLSYRALQRWFEREVGMPPRTYLRLLRLRDALRGLQASGEPLAQAAAAHGYADQAHMARDFRRLAGVPPREARSRSRGPFVRAD